MKKNLSIFWLFSIQSLKVTFQHSVGAVAFTFGKLLRVFVYFLFVSFLLSKTKMIAGYNHDQVILFFLTFNIVDTLGQMLFREVYRFRQLIVSGDFDLILVKPFHPFLRILVGGIDILDIITLIPYTALVWYYLSKVSSSGLDVLLYTGLIFNAMIIMTAFYIAILALGILTTEIDHATMIFRDLSRMATMPVDIYKEPLRSLITFVVPIGVMMSFPVKAALNTLPIEMYALSIAIGLIGLAASLYLWKKALLKYQSAGS